MGKCSEFAVHKRICGRDELLSFGDGLIETGRKEETRQLKPSNKDTLMVEGIGEAGNGKNQVIESPKLDKR